MVSLRLFSIAAVAAYASICDAAILTSTPVAGMYIGYLPLSFTDLQTLHCDKYFNTNVCFSVDTRWVIGSSAEIHWRLSTPTAKNSTATIFLVGGGKKQKPVDVAV
jgi:hypothetical protein